MYDILFLGQDDAEWQRFKLHYPNAHRMPANSTWTDLKKQAFTKMFWVVWDKIVFAYDFNLNEYRADEWDNMYVHVFKNGNIYDGVCLFSKKLKITQKEIDYRYFVKRKEVDISVSVPEQYEKIYINNYEDYINKIKKVTSDFVWVIPDDITVDYKFDYQIPYWEQDIVHIFRNGKYFDGIFLQHKNKNISQKEINYRFFIKKKEIDITASNPIKKELDIVFISYNEPNADKNFELLQLKFPRAQRVHGITGIHNAHIEAAKLCTTDMFYVVDADAIIVDNFNFDYQVERWNKDAVHVFRSKNPINDLVYGYGGIKLLPRIKTLNLDTDTTDMTTSISSKFKAVDIVSNITAFNTDPFNTWKSAFRECVKLSSKVIARQKNNETDERLLTWCVVGEDRPYGKFAILGAKMGKDYGESHRNDKDALKLINNFKWLEQKFKNEVQ